MNAPVTRTTDLGCDWYANEYADGSMTLHNPEKGQRIDLEPASVERLRAIFRGRSHRPGGPMTVAAKRA